MSLKATLGGVRHFFFVLGLMALGFFEQEEVGARAAAAQHQNQGGNGDHQDFLGEKLTKTFLRRGFRAFAFRLFTLGFCFGRFLFLGHDGLSQLSLRGPPYANVVKEWFKLPGGASMTRQVFPHLPRGVKKTQ